MTITFQLGNKLEDRLLKFCIKHNVSVEDVINEALRKYFKEIKLDFSDVNML